MKNLLNGLRVYAPVNDKDAGTRYVPLPRELWAPSGTCTCACEVCKGGESFWDTLAIAHNGYTWTVHIPQLQEGFRGATPDWLVATHWRPVEASRPVSG